MVGFAHFIIATLLILYLHDWFQSKSSGDEGMWAGLARISNLPDIGSNYIFLFEHVIFVFWYLIINSIFSILVVLFDRRKGSRERRFDVIFDQASDLGRWVMLQAGRTIEDAPMESYSRIVLKSRKVYIGFIVAPSVHRANFSHIAVVPMYSGYLDKDTLDTEITQYYATRYYQLHNKLNIKTENFVRKLKSKKNLTKPELEARIKEAKRRMSDEKAKIYNGYRVVVPMEEILTVSSFSPDEYITFRENNRQTPLVVSP
ncbi:MAG: hypothetical protein JJU10_05540 [Idiomarina sp.]|nr:hypothetical protein [Idiomarina sp.]